MEWSRQSSFAFLYSYNTDPYLYTPERMMAGGAEMNQMMQQASLPVMELNKFDYDNNNNNNNNNDQDKKKRLTSEQLEALENSFEEEIKLEPDRKMKLAQELGLQPRQIAIWFQNRRARWKVKQLERLYHALKQEFEAVFREKQKLQHEVLALRTILKEQVSNKQAEASTAGYTDMSGEETVESAPMAAIRRSKNHSHRSMVNYDGAAMHTSTYSNWAALPTYP